MPPHPLTNFELQKYYQSEPRFNGACSRDNLPKIKDGAYVRNLDEYSDIRTHWVVLHVGRASPKDVKIIMLLILIVLEWSIFQKR